MTIFTNDKGLSLSVAVWLADDNYQYSDDPYAISVTSLLKPIKQIVLARRLSEAERIQDVSTLVSSRFGQAIHSGVEQAWLNNYARNLESLGVPKRVIAKVRINPTPEELVENPEIIPVFMEQRAEKKVGKWTVTGQFDFVIEGRLEDFKSTTVFTYINRTKDEDYIMQGSMYRWLHPTMITQSQMAIQYIFTDWSARMANSKDYPKTRILEERFNLEDPAKVEAWIRNKISTVEMLLDQPEDKLPECTPKDLWQKESTFKYYKNPLKMLKSTANFDNLNDAVARKTADGDVGIVVEVKGQVVACKYCNAFVLCKQKDRYLADGSLK